MRLKKLPRWHHQKSWGGYWYWELMNIWLCTRQEKTIAMQMPWASVHCQRWRNPQHKRSECWCWISQTCFWWQPHRWESGQTRMWFCPESENVYSRELWGLHGICYIQISRAKWEANNRNRRNSMIYIKARELGEGDSVYIHNFSSGSGYRVDRMTVDWMTGPVSCTVLLGNGNVVKRHID